MEVGVKLSFASVWIVCDGSSLSHSPDSCCHTLLLSLNSLLPVPWDSSICSKQVTILFSCDPRNAVIRTVGKDKERKQQPFLTSGNTTITKQSKTSIALVPVRVNLPVSTVGSKVLWVMVNIRSCT